MRRTVFYLAVLSSWCAVGCGRDPACEKMAVLAPQLEKRLKLPGDDNPPELRADGMGTTRSLTREGAKKALVEVEALKGELPTSAKDETLAVTLAKMEKRRNALEIALEEFLAFDPSKVEGGVEAGAVMPLRRAVVMSRNRLLTLADNAAMTCSR